MSIGADGAVIVANIRGGSNHQKPAGSHNLVTVRVTDVDRELERGTHEVKAASDPVVSSTLA